MHVVSSIDDLQKKLADSRPGKTVGFVPTMGALHAGHTALIKAARAKHDIVVVSLFVNPNQFGPSEDFDSYPRPLEHDVAICERENVDLLFTPSAGEMYTAGYATYVLQERYTEAFEGEIRTGHFHGVCTVCAKLFNIVKPNVAYFGQKDYQQTVVIRRMVRDLNFDLSIEVCPTVREPDGLAMSSRNVYLSPEERRQATCLYRALSRAKELYDAKERSSSPMIAAMEEIIRESPLAKVDYLAVVNPESLREIRRVESEAIILGAIRLGRTRLIDNIRLASK